jgi:SAM-dependent methyltransferase
MNQNVVPDFDFGRNWESFSRTKLNVSRLHDAARSLDDLLGKETVPKSTFLDVGCGSGIFSLAAAHLGASKVVGFDLNPTAIAIAKENAVRFADFIGQNPAPDFRVGSILDETFCSKLGSFDTVYAWGSLHHTGHMWNAIQRAASLANKPSGRLGLAIYNRHWTCPIWKGIKILYNIAPPFVRKVLKVGFTGVIFVGASITTGSNPMKKDRGMDFLCDVEDWLGGYPYEYAGVDELSEYLQDLGLHIKKVVNTKGWTGCNELVGEYPG